MNTNQSYLIAAIKKNDIKTASLLIESKADVNPISDVVPLNLSTSVGMTKLLLSSMADVNSKDTHGMTPIMTAFANKDKQLILFLLDNNATLRVDEDPFSPFLY